MSKLDDTLGRLAAQRREKARRHKQHQQEATSLRQQLDRPIHNTRQRSLAKLEFASWGKYLRSQLWLGIESRFLGGKATCRICLRLANRLFHLHYSLRALRDPGPSHLVPLCQRCLQYITRKKSVLRPIANAQALCKQLIDRTVRRGVPQHLRNGKTARYERWAYRHGGQGLCERCRRDAKVGLRYCGPCLKWVTKKKRAEQTAPNPVQLEAVIL